MKSLIPEHLKTSTMMSLSRLSTAAHLRQTINYLHNKRWPDPAKPVIQFTITLLEREYLANLKLGHSELGNLIKHLEEQNVDLSPKE